MAEDVHYHLRVQVTPGPDVHRRAQELARFCLDHGVEEAVLFFAGEDWNDGILGDADLERWLEPLAACREALNAAGVSVSLNPWYTVLHTDRGRHFPEDYSFTPMVSPSGVEAKAVASFASPMWQRYIARLFARCARLGFRVIWIEDDFRYHNHAPLDWGGDFSTPMLERFAEKLGQAVTRQDVVSAILQPGEPHPWRALWQETWREAQLDAVRGIRQAVREAAPGTLLGLMSSHPSNHSIEGRDWTALFGELAVGGKAGHRPHFAGYQDSLKAALCTSSFMLDYQKELRPPSVAVEVAPEIENFPMTPFSKSDTVTWGQMALAQLHGADALQLDLFSFTVTRLADEPWVGRLLDAARPGLAFLAGRFPREMRTSGVGVLWQPDASLRTHVQTGTDMAELGVPLTSPADLLQSLGVAVQARSGAVNCLWGPAAWAYTDKELGELLSGRIWLDAEAVEIVQERGLGDLVPVAHDGWWDRQEKDYSLEHPERPETGIQDGTWLSVNAFSRVARQVANPGDCVQWTSLRDAKGGRIGLGFTVGRNELGGMVATCPWPLAREWAIYPLSFHRQMLVQRLIAALAEGEANLPATTTGAAYCFPLDFSDGETRRVALFNAAIDPALPTVRVPRASAIAEAYLLAPNSEVRPLAVEARRDSGGLVVSISEPIPFCGLVVLDVG